MRDKPKTRVIAEFSIVPIGQESTSLSRWVAEAIRGIGGVRGIKHQLTPMGTILEADGLEPILEAIKAAHGSLFSMGADRVLSTLRIDDRRDKPRTMKDKVESVREYLKD